ncbi:MAG: glycoside hydrolase family 28 protein [Bryobacteraceae bacterium]
MLPRRTLLEWGGAAFWTPAASRVEPAIPSRAFDAREHGARGDGKTKDTGAIQKTIDAAFQAGGGVAYVPPGTYLTGGLEIRSRVRLHLEAGATLRGSTDLSDYQPHDGPPAGSDANQKHLIYARNADDIAITGQGVIDGQGPSFWAPSGRPAPKPEDLWRDVATYDWKKLARPSPMVELVECRNVRMEGVTLANSPGWTLRPIACDSVFIRGIRIRNPIYGPNTDGIDPTCCQNVFIADCDIATGDDTICLKSENPYGGPVRVSKNITIANCVLTSCCNGFKMGTATRGGFENIAFTNSVVYNNDVPLNQRVIAGIAVEMVDGGWVDGVVISNIRMQNVRTPIFVRLGSRHGAGRLRGVMISNVHATGAILTSSITGVPGHAVEDVTLDNIRIDTVEGGKAEWAALNVPEKIESYPEARMFGRLPSYGIYCRHAAGLRLRNVQVNARVADPRPLLACDQVEDLDADALNGTAPGAGQPLVQLTNVQRAFFRGSRAPADTSLYARVSGAQSAGISILGNDLSHAAQIVETTDGAPTGAVFASGNHTAKG